MQKIKSIFAKVRQLGVGGLLRHAARRGLTVVGGGKALRYFLFVLDTPRPVPVTGQTVSHVFRFATLQDLERLRLDAEAHLHERDIVSFQSGCRCLLQLDGETLVGYTWCSFSSLVEIMGGFHFNMPDDMVYNFNDYTLPGYRGQAYQGLRHLKMLEHIRAEGRHRLLCFVDHLNYRSLHGVRKGGYRHIGIFRGLKHKGRAHFSLSVDEGCWASLVRSGPIQS